MVFMIDSWSFTWIVLPIMIFIARILDVSIGTIRVIFIAKGNRTIAPILGFFEVSIWLLAIRQILVNVSNVATFIAYGAGFAAGTFIGMYIEELLSLGTVIIRVVTNKDSSKLLTKLQQEGFVVTSSGAKSGDGKVKILFIVLERDGIFDAVKIVKKYHPNAFYSVEDVRFVSDACKNHKHHKKSVFSLRTFRKGK